MKDLTAQFLAVFIILLVVFALNYGFGSYKCSAKGKSFDDSDYGPIQGCMVLHNDRWLPIENIRGFDSRG
ncbi:hypothetical protein [Gilvimarinus chinensis]|uniref:hypothetical protein n=1 Tax=Gilvimarinus chinensis TaxID=396005 RepID=UPI000378619D|nr:hypothetical protein [Gilvimarinus chinensis]